MHEIAHQRCLLGYFLFGFFQRSTAEAAEPIFTHNTSSDIVPSHTWNPIMKAE